MKFEARKDRLIHNNKIEVRKSNIHGYGVFATDFIKKGEILEECHLIVISHMWIGGYSEDSYVFGYPKGRLDPIEKSESPLMVLPTGFGAIYNTSEDAYGANANWTNSGNDKHWETHWPPNGPKSDNIFIFTAVKDIQKDEEILIDYSNVTHRIVPELEQNYSYMRDVTDNFTKRTKPKLK